MVSKCSAMALAIALGGVSAASAQAPTASGVARITASTVAPVVAVARFVPTDASAALPANTEVWLSPNAEVNSKRIKSGQKFEMTVARDVMLGNYIVIPRGTRGYGQIAFRSGKGAFGKSGKMEFNIVDLELAGQPIPLTGHYRVEGQGNTGATVGALVAVGVFSAFVTGHSASVAQGAEYKAFTTNVIPVALAAAPSPTVFPATVSAPVRPSLPLVPIAAKTTSPAVPPIVTR